METELNTKKNRLHDEAYWAQVTEELEREEEEEIEVLLEEMIKYKNKRRGFSSPPIINN